MTDARNLPIELAKDLARAVGRINTALFTSQLTKSEAHQINTLPEETLKRRIKTIYSVTDGIPGIVKTETNQIPESLLEFHEGWVEFLKCFGIAIDLKDYPLPSSLKLKADKNYWSIVVPPVLNPQKAYAIREQIGQVYSYINIGKVVDIFPRVPVSVIEANQNAIAEYPNVSTLKSLELGLFGTTLSEGCLIDGRVWKDLGMHLDENGWTLHTGSRNEDGHVPRSRWDDGRFGVYPDGIGRSNSSLSLRQKQF